MRMEDNMWQDLKNDDGMNIVYMYHILLIGCLYRIILNNMQSYAINPNKKTVIFYCEHQFNRSFFEMSLTDEQYTRMLEFHSNIDF